MSVIKPKYMNYEWGKIGSDSVVYQVLQEEQVPNLDPKLPYAELWLGDHEKAPAILENGKRLSEDSRFGEIPYLFKILSVNKPLSLQLHPTPEKALILHAKDPKNYPDSNSKPEMALFITKTMLLFGFRELHEIKEYIEKVPLFKSLLPKSVLENADTLHTEDYLKEILFHLLGLEKSVVIAKNNELVAIVDSLDISADVKEAVKIIHKNFPEDIGVFYPFILNVASGEPGQAAYITPGVLHAYLKGDLYEAMKQSDNVIRGGMTPKFIDIESLKTCGLFRPSGPTILSPKQEGPLVAFYPPYKDFCLKIAEVEAGKEIQFDVRNITMAFVETGKGTVNGTEVRKGMSIAIPTGKATFKAESNLKCILCTSQ